MIKKMKHICDYKEFGRNTDKSVKDYISNTPIPEKNLIMKWFSYGSWTAIRCMTLYDYIKDQLLSPSVNFFTDGEYEWSTEESYHFEKYNMVLNQHFIDKVVRAATMSIGDLMELKKKKDPHAETIEAKLCRCIDPPPHTKFLKNEIYRWGYAIDGTVAYHESGERWDAGEIDFLWHFEILSGKY